MRTNKTIKWLFALIMIFSLFSSGFKAPAAAENEGFKATITVVNAEKNETLLVEKEISFSEQATALDVLSAAVGEDEIETDDFGFGKFITGIFGVEAHDSFYWGFYIDGVSAPLGASAYQVRNGDKLTFVLEDYTNSKNATIKVVGEDNNTVAETAFPTSFYGNVSALALLQSLVGQDNVVTVDYPFGLMIESINGITAVENESFWSFMVNGDWAMEGAGTYLLKQGDEITFTFEKMDFDPPIEEPGNGDEQPSDGTKDETPGGETEPIDPKVIQVAIDHGFNYIPSDVFGEWEVIALNRSGKKLPSGYLQKVTEIVKAKDGKFRKITDAERYSLGILAAGGNPTNVAGYNLISAIYDGDVTKQGINGVAYALITLDSANFDVPAEGKWTREKLVQYLIDHQEKDGRYTGLDSDVDLTAMVLTALAPYKNQPEVKTTINNGMNYISEQYQSGKIDSSSAVAQVIIALSALGLDANNELISNKGVSIVAYLLSFQNEDKGFGWKIGHPSEFGPTSQSVQALTAYQLFLNGKGSLFSFMLSEESGIGIEQPEIIDETEGMDNPGIEKSKPVEQKGKTLPNTSTNQYNLLVTGLIFVLLGLSILVTSKRRMKL